MVFQDEARLQNVWVQMEAMVMDSGSDGLVAGVSGS